MKANGGTSWFVYCFFDKAGAPIYVGMASRDEEFQLPQSYPLRKALEEAGEELPLNIIREGGLTCGAAEMILRGLILAIGCKPTGTLLNDSDVYPDIAFNRTSRHARPPSGRRLARV